MVVIKIMKIVDLNIKALLLLNFFRSISNPMTKRRKYIPNCDKKLKVWDDVMV